LADNQAKNPVDGRIEFSFDIRAEKSKPTKTCDMFLEEEKCN
jgi:hypothetical protein